MIGSEGVSIVLNEGRAMTVRYADCIGMEAAPDGCRLLWGRDGAQVPVEPSLWRDGATAVVLIDAAVPADRRIPVARISSAEENG